MKLYDLGLLVFLLFGVIAGQGIATDAGHPINSKTNPTEVSGDFMKFTNK